MNLETAFKIWEYLKQEFQGNARTKSMRILNLKREFELQKMDLETIREYADKLFELVNKLRLIGEEMPDSRVVEKLLVTLPERFEAKISALEESKDLSTITLAELLSALEAHEQYYRSLIGCLMYLTASRLNIEAVNFLSRFLHCANEEHLQAAKRVVRYIKGTFNYGVKYTGDHRLHLIGFADSDWAGAVDDMKSTTGFSFNFGSCVFNWCSKKQDITAQSTAEAELVAATSNALTSILDVEVEL